MPVPPIPPPVENLGHRPFSFYPPILNGGNNEWHFRRATWSEILVANVQSGQEIWIPRRFLGEISRIDEPVVIVGLTKELEYAAGQVLPHVRRIIEMPRAVNDTLRPIAAADDAPKPAPVVGIRLESRTESKIGRLIGAVLVLGVLGCFLIVSIFRSGRDGSHIVYKPILQSELGLTGEDDYFSVVRKLGQPVADRWRSGQGEMRYRLLTYPDRDISVVLMGSEEGKARYIGAFDKNWRVVDSVTLPGGGNTSSMMRALPRF
jgi:hypothetical protein